MIAIMSSCYEISREFAPYVGVGYESKLGETRDLARVDVDVVDGIEFLMGLRAWF